MRLHPKIAFFATFMLGVASTVFIEACKDRKFSSSLEDKSLASGVSSYVCSNEFLPWRENVTEKGGLYEQKINQINQKLNCREGSLQFMPSSINGDEVSQAVFCCVKNKV